MPIVDDQVAKKPDEANNYGASASDRDKTGATGSGGYSSSLDHRPSSFSCNSNSVAGHHNIQYGSRCHMAKPSSELGQTLGVAPAVDIAI